MMYKLILNPQSFTLAHRLCLAPMLSYTDRHFRYLLRLISKRIFLYSEMIVTKPFGIANPDLQQKLIHRFFEYNAIEHPIGLQLAGNSPKEFSICSKIAKQFDYDEINLNIGCPSPRVQSGSFGVCLMKQPDLVCDCIKAIKDTVDIPVSLKTRLGVDEFSSYDHLLNFIGKASDAGCSTFIIHARLAHLSKTIRKNRSEIPLQYQTVYQLKKDFPLLTIVINGEIKTMNEISQHLLFTDGIMIGRAIYQDPLAFRDVDHLFFGDAPQKITPTMIIESYLDYMKEEIKKGEPLQRLSKHLITLIKNQPNASMLRNQIIKAKAIKEVVIPRLDRRCCTDQKFIVIPRLDRGIQD